MFLSSLYFALLAKLKIWRTTETYSPQTFSVTAAVVAPAVVICLNSLVTATRALRFSDHVTKRNGGSGDENGTGNDPQIEPQMRSDRK